MIEFYLSGCPDSRKKKKLHVIETLAAAAFVKMSGSRKRALASSRDSQSSSSPNAGSSTSSSCF